MADTVKKKLNLNCIEMKCANNIRGESGICCTLRGRILKIYLFFFYAMFNFSNISFSVWF